MDKRNGVKCALSLACGWVVGRVRWLVGSRLLVQRAVKVAESGRVLL